MNNEPTADEYAAFKFKVMWIGRKSNRRKILRRHQSLEDARAIVNSYPNSNRSIVCYTVENYCRK